MSGFLAFVSKNPICFSDGSMSNVEHYDHLFKSLDAQADDDPQYPYPVYDSPSSEFESVLSSKEWVSDVNNERFLILLWLG